MIKLFRNVRRNLINDPPEGAFSDRAGGKTSRYLKYSIGEIILVVIGILIALSINNWNSNRLEHNRADAFATKLKIQVGQNLSKVEDYSKRFEIYFEKSKKLIAIIGTKDTLNIDKKIDSLIRINSCDYHLNLDMTAITESRENGDLSLITSDIRETVFNLITENENVIARENIANEDLNLLFTPYLNKHYNWRNSASIGNIGRSKLYKNDNYKILNDVEFENYIISRMEYNKGNLEVYQKIKEELISVNQMLSSK